MKPCLFPLCERKPLSDGVRAGFCAPCFELVTMAVLFMVGVRSGFFQ